MITFEEQIRNENIKDIANKLMFQRRIIFFKRDVFFPNCRLYNRQKNILKKVLFLLVK